MNRLIFVLLLAIGLSASAVQAQILRYPNSSKTEIAFVSAGDIYTVPISGGIARRITGAIGLELFPRFSPDGQSIAFSGEYDGNRDVYVMPAIGGEPRRLTYSIDQPDISERQGPDKIIMQWSPDGKSILYRSRHQTWNVMVGKLYTVSVDGGLPTQYPIPRCGFASFSPDGKKIAYNRVFREYRTWKRYRGGQADDVWIYDPETKELSNITNNPAQDIIPMWAGNRIYFLSDRDKTMNLFCYDLSTKQTTKITNFTEFDIKFPSLGAEHIAFENGGQVYLMSLATQEVKQIPITVAEDLASIRNAQANIKSDIASFSISPDGKRGLFTARGDVFTVPAEKGNIRTLAGNSKFHERNAVWSPDAAQIAYISDETGEDEIFLVSPDGTGKTQLTNDAKSYRWEMKWSPDSKMILNSDKMMRLFYIDVKTKKTVEITRSKVWEIRDFAWSPDSKWIAYTDLLQNDISRIYLYNIETGKSFPVTSDFFSSSNPVFSKDGKYLYFTSDRTFRPNIGAFEYNFTVNNMTNIYGITLREDLQSPVDYYATDEAKITKSTDEDDENAEEPKAKKKSKKDKSIKEAEEDFNRIDLNNIESRTFVLPLPASNYGNLTELNGKIIYARLLQGSAPATYQFDLEEKKETKLGDFMAYEISADGKMIIIEQKGDYFISKFKENLPDRDKKLELENLTKVVDHREEWQQIFNEAWRQMRHFFYDPNMHGVDWAAIKTKYQKLVPLCLHRTDLTYLIGEMIGELNIGHAYVGGGYMEKVDPTPVGLLGGDFVWDASAKMYKITNILKGRNWEKDYRSPLTEPGIFVKAGDYIESIEGVKLTQETNPFVPLVGKADKYVNIKYTSKPGGELKEANVKTISNEAILRYFNWVERNRLYVDSVTGGKVGYIHIPDMAADNGLIEFIKYFYPQMKKQALIIDDRYNGGGNVSPMIIERLRRELIVAKNARNQQVVQTNPDAVMTGPIVTLINEISMSDGDLFPYQFKTLGIGKLIGKRSWGGVIGIRGSLPFVDGSYLNRPEFANFGANGKWILEGEGMTPDIDIDNHPAKEFIGIDEQLDKAIEVILEEMKTNKKTQVPSVPEYPKKN